MEGRGKQGKSIPFWKQGSPYRALLLIENLPGFLGPGVQWQRLSCVQHWLCGWRWSHAGQIRVYTQGWRWGGLPCMHLKTLQRFLGRSEGPPGRRCFLLCFKLLEVQQAAALRGNSSRLLSFFLPGLSLGALPAGVSLTCLSVQSFFSYCLYRKALL